VRASGWAAASRKIRCSRAAPRRPSCVLVQPVCRPSTVSERAVGAAGSFDSKCERPEKRRSMCGRCEALTISCIVRKAAVDHTSITSSMGAPQSVQHGGHCQVQRAADAQRVWPQRGRMQTLRHNPAVHSTKRCTPGARHRAERPRGVSDQRQRASAAPVAARHARGAEVLVREAQAAQLAAARMQRAHHRRRLPRHCQVVVPAPQRRACARRAVGGHVRCVACSHAYHVLWRALEQRLLLLAHPG